MSPNAAIRDYLSGSKPRMHSFETVWWISCSKFKRCAMVPDRSCRHRAYDGLWAFLAGQSATLGLRRREGCRSTASFVCRCVLRHWDDTMCYRTFDIRVHGYTPSGRWRDSRNEFYGRFAGIAGSIRFDARELHHLAPLFGFLGQQLAEVGRRAWKCGGAQLSQP